MTSVAVSTPDNRGGGFVPYYRRYQRRAKKRTTRKKSSKKKTTSRKSSSGSHKSIKLSKFLIANINPFDPAGDGAKVPDSNTYPSTPLTVDDEFNMSTDAVNGLVAFAYRPYMNAAVVAGVPASANSWTWPAAYSGVTASGKESNIASQYGLYRPVAHGVRLYAPTAPTSTTGFVHVAIYAESQLGKTTWNFPTSVAQMNNCMFYNRYPLALLTQKSITVVNKFLDQTATRYLDPATDVADTATDLSFQTPGWATIIVAVEGAPNSTKALVVESTIRVECLPLASGINTATPAAPFNISSLESVSRMAGSTPGAFVEGEEESYMQHVGSSLGRGFTSVFGPAVERAAYYAGRSAANAASNYIGAGIAGVTSYRQRSGFRGGLIQLTNGY